MLFPSLASTTTPATPAKPYVICGVLFTPLPDRRWLLSRAPLLTTVPPPLVTFPNLPLAKRLGKSTRGWKWPHEWSRPRLFDGRFWIRLRNRLPCALRVAPFDIAHHNTFHKALADDAARKDLAALLRRHAPGKTRYTVPAVYANTDVTALLRGEEWWPDLRDAAASAHAPAPDPDPVAPRAPAKSDSGAEETQAAEMDAAEMDAAEMDAVEMDAADMDAVEMGEPDLVLKIRSKTLKGVHAAREAWEKGLQPPPGGLQLLALPTLGVGLPGLDDWLRWDVSYRKVDRRLLALSRLGGQRMGRREFRIRVRWRDRWIRLGKSRVSRPKRG
jgi:hypothetical protein